MKLNRDQKGRIALGVLGTAALYMVYANLLSGPSIPAGAPVDRASTAAPSSSAPASSLPPRDQTPTKRPVSTSRGRTDEFHPVWRSKRLEERIDPMKVDPTLMTDLLAKVTGVEAAGGSRNLFAFGQPPPKAAELPKGPEPKLAMYGPPEAPKPAPPPADPPKPPPPPITLKFYGFSSVRENGRKSAYFLDGDDILIAAEGDTLKKRYKVLRISAASVLMEDTDSKTQQSVPLTQEAPSS